MKSLTLYLHGLMALSYGCLGAASIKTKCSRCYFTKPGENSLVGERKVTIGKLKGEEYLSSSFLLVRSFPQSPCGTARTS